MNREQSDNDALDGDADSAVASTRDSQRRGDVEKCPVCGSHVDSEAYHCPTCRNYFCYHCRARLLLSEKHLQCVSQECDYYGKLVCAVCNPLTEMDEAPSVYAEPEDGYWPGWLAAALVLAALVWYWSSFPVAVVVFIIVFGLGGFLMHSAGINIFGSKRTVEQQRKSRFFTCVRCGSPTKEVVETT